MNKVQKEKFPMRPIRPTCPILPLLAVALLLPFVASADSSCPWDLAALSKALRTYPAPEFKEEGVTALFYDGLPFQGKPTRVFAWIGKPAAAEGTKVPGMVLVHGGGGTAFAEWVRLWTARGYAAIAMDTCGQLPTGKDPEHPRHEFGGPAGWGGFDNVDDPITDQWSYHAVADVILANSLLRSMPEVDPDRIGLTGISWGGYLTCITASVDKRFRFAAPVYGCGFLGEESAWTPTFEKMGPEKAGKWLQLWDPSVFLPQATLPFLWVTGTNDEPYHFGQHQKSYRLPKGPRTLCIRVRMPHSHPPGWECQEIYAFADNILKGGPALPSITGQGNGATNAWVTFDSPATVTEVQFNYTTDTGPWPKRNWHTVPANFDTQKKRAEAAIPPDTKAFYFNVIDDRAFLVSSEMVETK